MSKKQTLRPGHIVPGFGPHLELSGGSDPLVVNGANGLLRLDTPFQIAPLVTDMYLAQFVDKPLGHLFKEFRDSTYTKEWDFLKKLHNEWQKQHGWNNLALWKKIHLSMCTQCALENWSYHPFLEQDAKRWLQAKFRSQKCSIDFNDDIWEDLKQEYVEKKGRLGLFYCRNGNQISFLDIPCNRGVWDLSKRIALFMTLHVRPIGRCSPEVLLRPPSWSPRDEG